MYQFINTVLNGITSGAIFSLMAIALVLVWRSTRVINFAQSGMALLSTYIGFECIQRLHSFWIALPLSMIAGAFLPLWWIPFLCAFYLGEQLKVLYLA